MLSRRRAVGVKNLKLAFPDLSDQKIEEYLKVSGESFGRMLTDTLRYKNFNSDWVRKHVKIDDEELYTENLASGRPVLKLTGHYGSFDISTATHAAFADDGAILVRDLKNPFLSTYIRGIRELQGVKTYSRERSLLRVLRELKRGCGVGMLFDQNVTRKHAVFVEWFGTVAATTVAPAMLSYRTDCIVQIELVAPRGFNSYELKVRECPNADLKGLSEEEYNHKFTQRAVSIFEELVREEPEHWFWFHRRWKTRPPGEDENFY